MPNIVDIPAKRVARFGVPIEKDGRTVWRDMAEVDSSGDGAHPNWPDRFFARIVDSHLLGTRNPGGRVGNATSHLLRAAELLPFALATMKAVARDAREAP